MIIIHENVKENIQDYFINGESKWTKSQPANSEWSNLVVLSASFVLAPAATAEQLDF